jgi:hypothetical protein
VDTSRAATHRSLKALRHARRRRRVAQIDWVDALYKAYITAIVVGAAIAGLVIAAGGARVDARTLHSVRTHGAAWIGLAVGGAVALGLRSGSRGGPLALEAADVSHVLLAPVDRGTVLRGEAWRQLRGVMLVGPAAGGIAGALASPRLTGPIAVWVIVGIAFGALVAGAVWGSALLTSGGRLTATAATTIGIVLVAWTAVDVVAGWTTSPASLLGSFALWPLRFSAVGVVGVVVAAVVPVAGMLVIGGLSIEAAERRASLVGQLRFAATVQDVRTVIVLHRQLAQEEPRRRPWRRVRPRTEPGHACWRRGWQGALRWPAGRVARFFVLGAVAGAAGAGAAAGTAPLIVVAGGALFLAALDATEALAQESDHPDLGARVPIARGTLLVRHLPVAVCLLVLGTVVGAGVAFALVRSVDALTVALVMVVPAAATAAGGAAVAVVLGARAPGALDFSFPEFASIGLVLRTAIPPAIAIAGIAPVLAARQAMQHGGSAVGAAGGAALGALIVAVGAGSFASIWATARS